MDTILNTIDELKAQLDTELAKVRTGVKCKAAARRARKLTLELAKVFKDFRKESVKI